VIKKVEYQDSRIWKVVKSQGQETQALVTLRVPGSHQALMAQVMMCKVQELL
jgi:hypothetical protein